MRRLFQDSCPSPSRSSASSHHPEQAQSSCTLIDSESFQRVSPVLFASFNFPLQRNRQPELMDQPGLKFAEHAKALRGLRRINLLSRTSAVFWRPVARLARELGSTERPIRMLDLASGGGDTPIALARRAARAGLPLEIDGCDLNPQAVRYAQEQADTQGVRVRFFVLDALNESIPMDYDILSCSLFLHHLDDADAIALLREWLPPPGDLC